MNLNKICFITCVNDEEMYQESVLYINQLVVPDGFEVECVAIRNAGSLTKAYNQAMQSTNAKYKVYLHQDVFIVNKNFICDILHMFKQHKEIGMIGVAGTEQMPTSGCWWKSNLKFHHTDVCDNAAGRMCRHRYPNTKESYAQVIVIDGLMMITQYDVMWREDLFDGWHFYDMSQSVEFLKKNYKIITPVQTEPWCIHDCGSLQIGDAYEEYRNKFLDEYSVNLFPMVSIFILIDQDTVDFRIAIENVICQTYRNIKIIVLDQSLCEQTAKVIQTYLYDARVQYICYSLVKDRKEIFSDIRKIAQGADMNQLRKDALLDQNQISMIVQMYLEQTGSMVRDYNGQVNEKIHFLQIL